MTIPIVLTFIILVIAVVLFITEKIRVDLVSLLVLGALALTGLVTPVEALSGFSNAAVVTVWAVFVLSGSLSRTGVANIVGRQMLRISGSGQGRLTVIIMTVSAVMSAFMNNVGVAALLLPVVVHIARRTNNPPSKLLMPLAYGSLLGGMTTLIGTPPNILASDALQDYGLEPFGLFDFAPVGLAITIVGILFMALIGRRLLPSRDVAREQAGPDTAEMDQTYGLIHLCIVQIPEGSSMIGKSLAESRLGSATKLTVLRIDRVQDIHFIPQGTTRLNAGDRLTVAGQLDALQDLQQSDYLQVETEPVRVRDLVSSTVAITEIGISPRSPLLGRSLRQLDFRKKYGLIVLAIWRDGQAIKNGFDVLPLQPGDTLMVRGERAQIERLGSLPDFLVSGEDPSSAFELDSQLTQVSVPPGSPLVGKTLADSRVAETAGLMVLGIVRGGTTNLNITADELLQAGDVLYVKGKATENLEALRGLQGLEIMPADTTSLGDLETDVAAVAEAVLSPHTTLVGKTLGEIHFRKRYELNVLAIFREGRVYQSDLVNLPLRFGDALLLHGTRDRLRILSTERDFVMISEGIQEAPRINKAPIAVGIMAAVVLSVLVGWLPISIAAVSGAALMVLTGCLTMDEAYRDIDWRAVFLIAGMLPLGIALDNTGAAQFIANLVISTVGGLGNTALIAGLFLLTMLASQIMPNPVVTVLMAPIALTTAADLTLSPYAIMMIVAVGAASSFLSPVGHPANVLIMGPGGYRFSDYIKVGLPLTVVILVVTLLVLPIFWPL